MEVLRTPDTRFAALPDYDFVPHYETISDTDGTDLRIHYVDEGPADAAPILLLHGEPSWSYLYRKFVPTLAASGHRVIAPDLIGFGRSDKPAALDDYSYERHVAWMSDWLEALDLTGITLFCQDWGGLIGLRLVAAFPDRFARVIVGNTGLPTGTNFSAAFEAWRQFSQKVDPFPTGFIVNGGVVRDLSPAEMAAYDAPYPDESYKSGARIFPTLVPVKPDQPSVAENIAAWKALERFDKPVLTCFSDKDPVTAGGAKPFIERVPGAKGQPHVTIGNAGHFLQEDAPEQLCAIIDAFVRAPTT
ncbi:haloalkane dehalogenase [Sphingomonas sp. So64.6b]|uniref:haloalkane dehalogenase n=1 Tax=Sphingomonas sp. So64.6b TaxID=2997354 RepID=UPI0016019B77|nr:haloalkane dehalogenase [Sphingomonas sp. So64.6b]QNA83400.1 haloalkane dehalogenase [Sphingomonas sp. So64.6b]